MVVRKRQSGRTGRKSNKIGKKRERVMQDAVVKTLVPDR